MNEHVKTCIKSNLRVILIGTAILFIFFLMLVITISSPAQFEPSDGIWYCDELSIQLSYEKGEESFVIFDDEKIVCACVTDPGSDILAVLSQDPDTAQYTLGETVFSGRILHLDSEALIVQDETSGAEYTFNRIG